MSHFYVTKYNPAHRLADPPHPNQLKLKNLDPAQPIQWNDRVITDADKETEVTKRVLYAWPVIYLLGMTLNCIHTDRVHDVQGMTLKLHPHFHCHW